MTSWIDPYESAPEAKVERLGRWWFRVYVTHGLSQWGPGGYGWHVLGERRALAKAERVLGKYIRQERRRADVRTVTLPSTLTAQSTAPNKPVPGLSR